MQGSNVVASMKNNVRLSFREEVGNVITHGVMALLLLISLPFVSLRAFNVGGLPLVVGTAIFIISLFLMFASSALYHAMDFNSPHKYVFRILDHIFVYVAIAGTYTPIALYVIGGATGYIILAIQWICVLIGILYKSIARKSIPKISVTIYLIMGWIAVLFLPQILRSTTPLFLGLILGGGICYSVGTYFYLQKDKPYFHMIWHLFINLASILHFIAIVFYI